MMPFKFIEDENLANKLPKISNVLSGVSNNNPGKPLESGFGLPWPVDPQFSWMDYNCWIECYLDSGMALHKPLPQSNDGIDVLSSQFISPLQPNAPSVKDGVHLVSKGNFQDVVQRMATSEYRFCLTGYGIRAGYQIPIPGLVSVAGVPAIPERSGPCYNRIIGNVSGVPLWYAAWELWYVVTLPPTQAQEPAPNFAEAIRGDQQLPTELQVPFSAGDYNSVPNSATLRTVLR